MAQPLVSIIINNYNYGQFLREAIDSALQQTYLYTEVIVVDDGSTDNSRDIIKSYGSRIIPLFNANGGQASAFNAGFAISGGEIICFLDSDDLFLPQKVAEVVSVFEDHQDIGWCYHAVQLFDDCTQKIIPCRHRWFGGKWDLRAFIVKGQLQKFRYCFPPTSGLCFRRSLLEQIVDSERSGDPAQPC